MLLRSTIVLLSCKCSNAFPLPFKIRFEHFDSVHRVANALDQLIRRKSHIEQVTFFGIYAQPSVCTVQVCIVNAAHSRYPCLPHSQLNNASVGSFELNN